MINTFSFLASHLIFRLADQGLSNAAGLATLRHGTNPLSWVAIHLVGAVPAAGGNSIGGDYGKSFDYQNKGRFYFAKGSPYPLPVFLKRYEVRLLPKTYAAKSTINLLKICRLNRTAAVLLGIFIGTLLPTIRLRFSQEKVERMFPDYSTQYEMGCSTDKWIPPTNIGTLGTVCNSLTYRTLVRMCMNPLRVLTGVIQLAMAGGALYFCHTRCKSFVEAHKTAIVAGAILGIL